MEWEQNGEDEGGERKVSLDDRRLFYSILPLFICCSPVASGHPLINAGLVVGAQEVAKELTTNCEIGYGRVNNEHKGFNGVNSEHHLYDVITLQCRHYNCVIYLKPQAGPGE